MITLIRAYLSYIKGRVREYLHADPQEGANTLEYVILAFLIAAAAVVVGGIIVGVIMKYANKIGSL